MITESDNELATAVYGQRGRRRAARPGRGGPGCGASRWPATGSGATFSAADQARFFRVFDRLVPRALTRLRPRAPVVDRALAALGLLALLARAVGFETFFKGGWRGTERAGSCTRRRSSSAVRMRFSMAAAQRRQPLARLRHRDAPRRGLADLRAAWRATLRPRTKRGRRRPSRRALLLTAGPGSWTSTASRPGSASSSPTRTRRNLTGRRLPGYCENWALLLEPGRARPRPRPALPAPARPRPPDPRRLPAGARHASARGLGRAAAAAADLVGTYIARRSRHNTGSAVDLTLVRAPRRTRGSAWAAASTTSARARTPSTPAAARCATA